MLKKLFFILVALALAGCSARAVLVKQKVHYDPATDARLRIYLINGNSTILVNHDTNCASWVEKKKTEKWNPFSKGKFNNGLPKKTLKNISVGMPMTSNSKLALERNSYFDTTSFKEMILVGGNSVVLEGWNHYAFDAGPNMPAKVISSSSCRIPVEFTPKAGKDYEAYYKEGNGYCTVDIYELKPLTEEQIKANQVTETTKKPDYKKCSFY